MKSNIITKGIAKMKQNSPEILIVTGVVGVVVATVKACKASRKLDSVLDDHKQDVEDIKTSDMDDSHKRMELAHVYGKTAWELFRMYAPSAAIGVGSVCLIFKGHGILKDRYVSLATTYGLLEKTYGTYRQRVVDELGEKMDQHFAYGVTEKEADVLEVDKKGKEKIVRKNVDMIEINGDEVTIPEWSVSPYARVFSPKSRAWQNGSFSLSLAYARQYEKYANDLLTSRPEKPLYLEEVYDWFDFEATEASHDAGWRFDPNRRVSFCITPTYAEVDGVVLQVILMDFNCSDVYSGAYRKRI